MKLPIINVIIIPIANIIPATSAGHVNIFCKAIENNLLLRSRVYYIVDVCCKDSKSIIEWLDKHQRKRKYICLF